MLLGPALWLLPRTLAGSLLLDIPKFVISRFLVPISPVVIAEFFPSVGDDTDSILLANDLSIFS